MSTTTLLKITQNIRRQFNTILIVLFLNESKILTQRLQILNQRELQVINSHK